MVKRGASRASAVVDVHELSMSTHAHSRALSDALVSISLLSLSLCPPSLSLSLSLLLAQRKGCNSAADAMREREYQHLVLWA